jgi:hypothetical protein
VVWNNSTIIQKIRAIESSGLGYWGPFVPHRTSRLNGGQAPHEGEKMGIQVSGLIAKSVCPTHNFY